MYLRGTTIQGYGRGSWIASQGNSHIRVQAIAIHFSYTPDIRLEFKGQLVTTWLTILFRGTATLRGLAMDTYNLCTLYM